MSESRLKLLREQLKFLDMEIQKLIKEEESSTSGLCPRCKQCKKGTRKRCRTTDKKKLLRGNYYGRNYYGRRCPNNSRKTCSKYYKKHSGGGDELISGCPILSKEEQKEAIDVIKFLQRQTGGGNLDYTRYSTTQKAVANVMGLAAGMIAVGIAPATIVSMLHKMGYADYLITIYNYLMSGYNLASYGCGTEDLAGWGSSLRSFGKAVTGAPSCADITVQLENALHSAVKNTIGVAAVGAAGSWYTGYWNNTARRAYNAVYDLTLRNFYGCHEKPYGEETEEMASKYESRKKRERIEEEAFERRRRYREDDDE